jgi:hypothetical protein
MRPSDATVFCGAGTYFGIAARARAEPKVLWPSGHEDEPSRVGDIACEWPFASVFTLAALLAPEPESYKLAVSKVRNAGMFRAATPTA